jgi:GntR family transcriptional regulator/MocR family aminotransferase
MRQCDLSLWIIPFTGKKPNSLQIEEFIIDSIKNLVVQSHESIPSHRTMARLNKVNRNTALRAYTKLIATGWLIHSRGGKAFVADPLPNDDRKIKPLSMPELLPVTIALSDRREMNSRTEKGIGFISVGVPLLDKIYQPTKMIAKYVREGFQGGSTTIGPGTVMETSRQPLRNAILQHLNLRRFNIRIEHLMVIRDRGECLRCLFKAISPATDIIVNTAPSDMLINAVIQECGTKMISLDLTASDFLLQLEELMDKIKVRVIYIRPSCSYPECKSLDEASCLKLIALAKKYYCYIIEEDDDHEFWWGQFPFKPLAHYDHGGFVIHCAALSRITPYMQNLRTVVAPAQLIDVLKNIPNSGFGYKDYSQERAITQLLLNSELLSFSRQARLAKQKDLRNLHHILQLQLGEYIRFNTPECGTGLWICFPTKVNLAAFFEILKNEGHLIWYSLNRKKPVQMISHMRLDFSRFNEHECRQVAIRLRSLLKKRV